MYYRDNIQGVGCLMTSIKISKEELSNLYITEEKSLRDCASHFQCSVGTVMNRLTEFDIQIRTRKQSTNLHRSKTRSIDVDFFNNESHDLFYILGLWATDGTVYERGSFSIGLTDRDVIDWVAAKIKYTNNTWEIKSKKENHKDRYLIQFSAKELLPVFNRYGITSGKSLSLQFPEIPEQYLKDFIRGVFDGDGSISRDKYSYRVSFVSASEDFIMGIKTEIEKKIGGDRKIHFDNRGSGVYQYFIYGKENINNFHNWIYEDENFGMQRKKDKFLKLKHQYKLA